MKHSSTHMSTHQGMHDTSMPQHHVSFERYQGEMSDVVIRDQAAMVGGIAALLAFIMACVRVAMFSLSKGPERMSRMMGMDGSSSWGGTMVTVMLMLFSILSFACAVIVSHHLPEHDGSCRDDKKRTMAQFNLGFSVLFIAVMAATLIWTQMHKDQAMVGPYVLACLMSMISMVCFYSLVHADRKHVQ